MRANSTPRQFSSWFPLTPDSVSREAPDGAAALQVRVASGLLAYPDGQSAMVCYLFATESARTALLALIDTQSIDDREDAGSDFEFRFYDGDGAREWLVQRLYRFESNLGALPLWNQPDEQTDADPTE